MTKTEKYIKRLFDIFFSCLGLILCGWVILLILLTSILFIGGSGIFKQKRVGQFGKFFVIYKIQTIHPKASKYAKHQITKLGVFLRKYKLDELPQLLNILEGSMSFVGPRPDLPGFADKLEGEERIILSVKPGITGPATLYFRNEEKLLKEQLDMDIYNKEIIWPQKVEMNMAYVNEYSFKKDIYYLIKTLF